MSHGTMAGTTNLIFRPEKHIEIITASSNNQVIGRALFANFTDEVNFSLVTNPEKQKKKMMKLITQIDARMKSRFLRGTYLPTLNIIASSKDTEQSFLEAYINTKRETESKNTLIIDEPQWVVDSRKDSPIKFWVGIGNKFLANELLPLDATPEEVAKYRAKGYEMWQVPIGYLDTFQTNLDEAICSVIGKATASSLKYISGERLNKIKTDKYKNPFVKDVIEVGNAENDHLQYANFFDLNRILPNDMNCPVFIHLDMSTGGGGKGDKTGIAGVIITGKRPTTKAQTPLIDDNGEPLLNVDTTEDNRRELQYKVLFSVSIKAPQGCQISFEKNRNFIRWLRDKGFSIKGISSDTFQSAQIQQELKSDGFEAQIISVDRVDKQTRTCLPYHYLKSAIYEKRIELYDKCDQLTNELVSLERLSDGHIDHPQNGSKDQADAVCGAIYLASKFSDEYSYNYVENLDASLDVSLEEGNTINDKKQKIVDFEAELTKLYTDTYDELDRVDRAERERKRQE